MADSTNLQAAAYTAQGTPRDKVALPVETFDGTVNMPAMHLAVKAFLANQRQGTHATKTRRWVVGGNQKPWRQKGTGRARQGSTRAPNWPGGGTVFGPQPRSYRQALPRQAKALARKSALNARAGEGALHVIDAFGYDAPKTSRLAQLLARLDVAHKKVLILTDGLNENVFKSGRNLPNVHVMPFSDASTFHVLWSDVVLVESAALGAALPPVAEKELAKVKVMKKKAGAGGQKAEAVEEPKAKPAAAKARTAAAKKAAPKKTAAKAAAKKPAKAAARKAPAPKKKGK
ncbi:MAG TPA: 50S ribosomal protein L4 [Gemmatimonadaceae bacterium]|nr:50S ribosomal protein L4 [Gemmatimonadaceae bacterium]